MHGLFINLKQRWRLVLRKIAESIIDTNRGVIKHLISMPRVLLSFFYRKIKSDTFLSDMAGGAMWSSFLGSFKRRKSRKTVVNE